MTLIHRSDIVPEPKAIAELYDAARLRRPTADLDRLKRMFQGSNVVLTVWEEFEDRDGQRLVALLRGWTDYAYDGYVCDLAVHPDFQKRGLGKDLLERAQSLGKPDVQWVLQASPIAEHYYDHIGWQKIENGWKWPREPYAHPGDPA
ncbi:MAG: GNAT family N-acetyltransferase [Acidobacteriota bacterium]|nr:GNAT family N-acetyltransferase [Acidobacteriota bacterium]